MSRKKFIESQGATCQNWMWSWSFINVEKRTVIFGVWDRNVSANMSLILSEDWEVSRKGRKQPAYTQAREHIRLVEEEGYRLMVFPMKYSDENKGADGAGPAKIGGFEPKLKEMSLIPAVGKWYASNGAFDSILAEEIISPSRFTEGASKTVSINVYERSLEARQVCINHHGCKCAVCEFDFGKFYGAIGEGYIHVHHVVPLAEVRTEYVLNPIEDLIPVCANCHSILHRVKPVLKVEQLKEILKFSKK